MHLGLIRDLIPHAKLLITIHEVNRLSSLKQECFNSPYGTQYFADYAETIPGESSNILSKLAKDLQIHLVGGSIPESCDGKIYNTTAVFGPDGEMLGKFSKVKLVPFMIIVSL